jgi:integral membrane protein
VKAPSNNINILFRVIAFFEGISYILLLFIAVPLKYFWGNEEYVQLFGMPHGLLFVAYLILIYLLKSNRNWNSKDVWIMIIASIIPFGTFYVDWKYLN